MFPCLFTVLTPQTVALVDMPPQPPDPIILMRDAFLGVLKQFGVERKVAQDVMGYSTRQHFDDALNARSFTTYRLSLLPDQIKRVLWQDLKRFFGYEAAEADNPELERRLAELEADNARQARELEATQRRFDELEKLVRRSLQPASPQSPHEERTSDETTDARRADGARDERDSDREGRHATGRDQVRLPDALPAVDVRGVLVGALLSAEREQGR